jgi:hypothetical protein
MRRRRGVVVCLRGPALAWVVRHTLQLCRVAWRERELARLELRRSVM